MNTPDLTRSAGSYDGTCYVCLQPCETALGFMGEVPWTIGCLTALGVPQDQAAVTVLMQAGGRGFVQMVLRLCSMCVLAGMGSWRFPIPARPPVFPMMVQPEFLPGGEAIGVHVGPED